MVVSVKLLNQDAKNISDIRYTLYGDEKFPPSAGAEYTFTIDDSYRDGISCALGDGSYEVMLNGEVVASGGTFDDSETILFSS